MGRTVLCPHCKSTFDEEILKKKNSMDVCLVCGESLLGNNDSETEPKKEKTKWYYYKECGGGLDDTLYSNFTPLYTFEAVDIEDAKRQLKEVMPDCPLLATLAREASGKDSPGKVRCPYCRSEQIQLVPKKFSILTGFATNRYNRVCLRCNRKF